MSIDTEPGERTTPWGDRRKPRPGDEFELVVEGLDSKGELFGVFEGYRVRVPRGAPGARVAVRVRKRRRDDLWTDVTAVVDSGPAAATPPCPHFGTCGGCRYQDIEYAAQLELLHAALVRVLHSVPLDGVEVRPVLPSPRVWRYRNKMDFTFSNRRWVMAGEPEGVDSDFALGLHLPGRHQKVLDIDRCEIAFEEVDGLLRSAKAIAAEHQMKPRDAREHSGFLRHLVLRKGEASGDVMVHLVTGSASDGKPAAEVAEIFASEITNRHPEVTTFVHTVTDRVSEVAQGDDERTLMGPGVLRERLNGIDFEVSAASFFQTNTSQAEQLLQYVRTAIRNTPGGAPKRIFDVYCGGGMFALGLAQDGARVVGFELVEAAVRDAEHNAKLNGIEGVQFFAGDVAELLSPEQLAESGIDPPDAIVVDPPRVGIHRRALAALLELAPKRIVYVSCNPKTAARDLAALCIERYRMAEVQPLDMFPHTPHLECVFVLDQIS